MDKMREEFEKSMADVVEESKYFDKHGEYPGVLQVYYSHFKEGRKSRDEEIKKQIELADKKFTKWIEDDKTWDEDLDGYDTYDSIRAVIDKYRTFIKESE